MQGTVRYDAVAYLVGNIVLCMLWLAIYTTVAVFFEVV